MNLPRVRLWHLTSAVAISAPILAIAARSTEPLAAVGGLALWLLPPLMVAIIWDGSLRQTPAYNQSSRSPIARLPVLSAWYLTFLMMHTLFLLGILSQTISNN